MHNTLGNYYRLNFSLIQHHKYSLMEIESLIVFERDLYVGFLINYLEQLKAQQQ